MNLETKAGILYVCSVIGLICALGLATCVLEWIRREKE